MAQNKLKQLKGMTAGSVVFLGDNGVATENNSAFYWDKLNERLGIGTASPSVTLHVDGDVTFDDGLFVFNEKGLDYDFRIESTTNTNLFRTDAANNNVGIRTSSPNSLYALDVNGSALFGTGTVNIIVGANPALTVDAGSGTNSKNFIVQNSTDGEYFTVTSSGGDGRVGINQSSPDSSYRLHVNGGARFDGSVRINDGTQATGYVFVSDSTGVGSWTASTNLTVTGDGNGIYDGSGTIQTGVETLVSIPATSHLDFGSGDLVITGQNIPGLAQGNNVGINVGTYSPLSPLQVLQGSNPSGVASPMSPLSGHIAIFQNNFNAGDSGRIAIVGGSNTTSILDFGDVDDIDIGRVLYRHSDNSMSFFTNATENMTLFSDGTLTVNGNSDLGATLNVEGDVRINDGTAQVGYLLVSNDTNGLASWTSSSGLGFPGGSGTDNSVTRWNGTSNIQDSDWYINDSGVLYPSTDGQDIGISGTNRVENIYMGGAGVSEGDSNIIVATGSGADRFQIKAEDNTVLMEINTTIGGLGNVGIGTTTGNDGRLAVKGGVGHTELFSVLDENGYYLLRTFNSTSGVQFGTQSNITIAGGDSILQIAARFGVRGNPGSDIIKILDNSGFQILNLDNDTKTFDLGASTTANFRYNDGSQNTDYVLTSDASGNATWKDIGALGGSGSTPVTVTGSGTDNHITRWDGTGTNTVQDSGVTLDDSDNITGLNNLTMDGSLIVQGDMTINGTTSTINTENLLVKDPIILLASTQSGTPTLDAGIFINRGSGITHSMIWDESDDTFAFISTVDDADVQGNVTITGYSDLRIGGLRLTDGTEANGYVLISDANGVGSWTASSNLTGLNGIYGGSGTVPSSTTATLTDNLTFAGQVIVNNSNIDSLIIGNASAKGGIIFNSGYTTSSTIYDRNDGTHNMGMTLQSRDNIFEFISSSGVTGDANIQVGVLSKVRTITGDVVRPLILRSGETFNDSDDGVQIHTLNASSTFVKRFQVSTGTASVDAYFTNIDGLGINTTTPSETLHVNGTFRLVDGTEASNYILSSDANGVASWVSLSSLGGSTVSTLHALTDTNVDFTFGSTASTNDGKMIHYDAASAKWITDDSVNHGTVVINGKSTGGGIDKGTPLYLTGFDADLHVVATASAASSATMPVIGFAAEDLNGTEAKHIITFGKIQGIDTTSSGALAGGESWSINDDLYVDTTTGQLTNVRPTGSDTQIQRVAKVLRVHATGGQLFIFNTARTAGLPNLLQNNIWIGNASNQPITTTFSFEYLTDTNISSATTNDTLRYDGSAWVNTSDVTIDAAGTMSVSGNLIIDTNTLFADSINNYVGVGLSTPSARLHIRGEGTATASTFLVEDSAGTDFFQIYDDGSWALGESSTALNRLNVVLGYNLTPTHTESILIGSNITEPAGTVRGGIYIGANVIRRDNTFGYPIAIGRHSSTIDSGVAIGGGNAAGGGATSSGGVAVGSGAKAGGGVAVGNNADASGNLGIAIGSSADGSGFRVVAIGAVATSDYSIAIGNLSTTTTVNQGVTIGYNTQNDTGSILIGSTIIDTGASTGAIGIGNGVKVGAAGAIGIGIGAGATGSESIAIGRNTAARAEGSIAMGFTDTSSFDMVNDVAKSFALGWDTATPTILLAQTADSYINGSGNLGIGTTIPSTKLHIVGDFRLVDGTQANGYILISDANGVASWTASSNITGATGTDLTGLGVDNRIARWNGTDTIQSSDWFINDSGVLYPNTDGQDIGITGSNRIGNLYMSSVIDFATDGVGLQITEGGTTHIHVATGSGYVGINQTSPSGRLHVVDTTLQMRIEYNPEHYTNIHHNWTGSQDGLFFQMGVTTDPNVNFQVAGGGRDSLRMKLQPNTSTDSWNIYNEAVESKKRYRLKYGNNSYSHFDIESNGVIRMGMNDTSGADVSIGLTATQTIGARLDIADDVNDNASKIVRVRNSDATLLFDLRADGEFHLRNYTFPLADGLANQILLTDGAGQLSFGTASSLSGLGTVNKESDTRNFTAGVTQSINHSLTTQDVIIQCYDSTGEQIIPRTIKVTGATGIQVNISQTLSNVKTVIMG